jgi:putative oxidoreductase
MNKPSSCCEKFTPYLLSLLRVVAAGLIVQYGGQKILGYPTPDKNITFSPFAWPIGVAGIIELVFGMLLVIGLLSRFAAFILSGEMAFAYFMAHASQTGHGGRILWPIHNGGTLPVLFCFVFLYLAAAGGGPIAVDRLFCRRCEAKGDAPPATPPPA